MANTRIIQTPMGLLYIQSRFEYEYVYKFDWQQLWTVTSEDEIHRVKLAMDVHFSNIQFRKYGQPKLKKPTELKNIKSFDKVSGVQKATSPLFIKGNDLYVQCKDYFSPSWRPPSEYIGAPLSVIARKFSDQERKEKFVYLDGWGDIVLRSEAWLKVSNVVLTVDYLNSVRIAQAIVTQQKQDPHTLLDSVAAEAEWERFWIEAIEKLHRYAERQKVKDVMQKYKEKYIYDKI